MAAQQAGHQVGGRVCGLPGSAGRGRRLLQPQPAGDHRPARIAVGVGQVVQPGVERRDDLVGGRPGPGQSRRHPPLPAPPGQIAPQVENHHPKQYGYQRDADDHGGGDQPAGDPGGFGVDEITGLLDRPGLALVEVRPILAVVRRVQPLHLRR
jgi:hypothetical protein